MLYTIVPLHLVLSGQHDGNPQSPPAIISPLGTAACAELAAGPDGQLRVSRLYASDPALFLDPRFSPGQPWRG